MARGNPIWTGRRAKGFPLFRRARDESNVQDTIGSSKRLDCGQQYEIVENNPYVSP